jgi:PAS domain S-box-containing protein
MAYPTEQRISTPSTSLSDGFSAKPEPLETTLLGVFDSLTDGILLMDEHFRFIYANQAARRISRILPEHLNSQTHWELYPTTIGTQVEHVYREVMATRVESFLDAFYFERFDIWFQIRVFPTSNGIGLHYRDITEQRRSQAARTESEDRLRIALSATNGIGVWDWDVANDRVYADERFAKIYGVDPSAAATGISISEFTRNIPAEDMEIVGPAIQKAVADGSEFISQYRLRQSDGSVVWVSARGRCPLDAAGAPTRFTGVIIDITDQKKQELALRESEARYRVLTELSPQSQWSANAEGLVLYANRRFLEYIGHDFVPETGEEYIHCFAPEDRERVVQVWSHAVATGEDYTIYARLLRASDGAARWWHLRALPVRDDQGKIQQWLGSANDIHEERVAADKLRDQYLEIDRQRRELETIYSASPIGMALYDPKDLCLLRINDRQAQIFRRPVAEALGLSYDELAAGVPAALALIRRAAQGETILNNNIEGTLDRKPGEYRYWNINYSPIFNEDGTVRSIAAATVETTQQKRAELALIQTEKLAAVGRMASSIAHEINNPLESVTNLIYIARQQAIMPEVQQILDLADQELRRVSIIANQTLRFHKQASSPREISCTDLYSTVLSLFEGRLKNSAIRVEKRKRAGRTVACFEGDIRQVLNNLVGNAIDAMSANPAATSRLLLRSRESTDWRTGRRGLTLTIADTGAGMSPETRSHIFEAFFTTKGINGTGLGLWISAEIVERHHGRLLLRSSQDPAHHGTVFSLFLPFQTLLKTKTIRPN